MLHTRENRLNFLVDYDVDLHTSLSRSNEHSIKSIMFVRTWRSPEVEFWQCILAQSLYRDKFDIFSDLLTRR